MKGQRKCGRPTKYNPKNNQIVTNYCLLGATNDVLADYLGVRPVTITRWLRSCKPFCSAVHAGRAVADAQVAKSTYQRAIGYSHDDCHIAVNAQGETTIVPFVKHYPPDTLAAKFWLMNRQRDKWTERVDVNATNTIEFVRIAQPDKKPEGAPLSFTNKTRLTGVKPDAA